MPKRRTLEFVKEKFEKEGYQLLAKEYINNRQPLDCLCPKGHRSGICWDKFNRGHRCVYCYKEKYYNNIEMVKKSFDDEGYTLLTTEYINNVQKLEYICPNGHRHSIIWNNWIAGRRCPYCNGRPIYTLDLVKKEFQKEGYLLLSTAYKNSQEKLEYKCPNGHTHSVKWANWLHVNQRCPTCHRESLKHTLEFVRSEFEKEGCELLSNIYINAMGKLDYICSEGHKHKISWACWSQGRRCRICKYIKMSGPGHPNWKGGIACEPYCEVWLDKDFKESIKARDNYECQNPLCNGKSKMLCLHHIDYKKKNCHPMNLITVCKSCNAIANYNREWHTAFYKEIMRRNNFSKNQINQEDLSWKEKTL